MSLNFGEQNCLNNNYTVSNLGENFNQCWCISINSIVIVSIKSEKSLKFGSAGVNTVSLNLKYVYVFLVKFNLRLLYISTSVSMLHTSSKGQNLLC